MYNVSQFIGIDPGKNGGIAVIRVDRETYKTAIELHKMPPTERDIWDLFSDLTYNPKISVMTRAVVERVSGYIGEKQPGSRMFNFGMGYGGLTMALTGCGIPFSEVAPVTWLTGLKLGRRRKGATDTEWKNFLRGKAQQLFPEVDNITRKTCDALLLAEYCRIKFGP